jgi:hypothetical protein
MRLALCGFELRWMIGGNNRHTVTTVILRPFFRAAPLAGTVTATVTAPKRSVIFWNGNRHNEGLICWVHQEVAANDHGGQRLQVGGGTEACAGAPRDLRDEGGGRVHGAGGLHIDGAVCDSS